MRQHFKVIGTGLILAWMALAADQPAVISRSNIDASSLHHKVLCGYQGWFRCPGDPSGEGWRHWSRNSQTIRPEALTFEMWPDTSEFTEDEKYPVPGFSDSLGKPAHLFSSAHPLTVQRHFDWMQHYGIDGVFVQRFLVNLRQPSLNKVLDHVRDSATKTGRVYAICYDLTDVPEKRIYDLLVNDWKKLIDEKKITEDGRYLHHEGKPVVFIWGFFSDRFSPALAHQIIDFFKNDPKYRSTLIGGCHWQWRTEKNAEWARAFRRFDVISPWNVGNTMISDGVKNASTNQWKDDQAEAKKVGISYLPVIYPGFGWTNLKGKGASGATIPRRGGEFFWKQFTTAASLGMDMAYVAMFDEVDEATAIFKVSNTPPRQAQFSTYEGLPPDWYLRLTGEGTKVIRGEHAGQLPRPIKP